MIGFIRPEIILLTPLLVVATTLLHFYARRIKRSLEVFHYPPVKRLIRIAYRKGYKRRIWSGIGLALKIVTILLLTFSLAGPYLLTFEVKGATVEVPIVTEETMTSGFVLALDVSASMGLKDVYPTRLEAAKQTIVEFVRNASETVGFGVVAFEKDINQSLPITRDRSRIDYLLTRLNSSRAYPCIDELTDIGYGLQTAIDFLATYSNESSAIILLSDGFANYGDPNPMQSVFNATQNARRSGIPVFAVHTARMGQDSNPELMEWIAYETGGKFLRAGDVGGLLEVLDVIGKYYAPTHAWSEDVEITTTIPVKRELGTALMLMALATLATLWMGNYIHYKTAF